MEKNNLQGKLKFSLFVGASSGAETENRWARLDMIERRSPHQVGKEIAKGISPPKGILHTGLGLMAPQASMRGGSSSLTSILACFLWT